MPGCSVVEVQECGHRMAAQRDDGAEAISRSVLASAVRQDQLVPPSPHPFSPAFIALAIMMEPEL